MVMVINFSGGKDSCAMLAYLVKRFPKIQKYVVFADTGWEHPDTEAWCRQIVEGFFNITLHVVRNPNKTFLTMALKRGKFPGMQQRQCTSDLKRDPINTWIRQNIQDPQVINCMGLRAEESPGRAKKPRWQVNKRESNSKRTIYDYLPIQDWPETRVLQYLEACGIPLHPVYKYLRRFSCRVCLYMTKHDVLMVQQNDPEAIDIIAGVEERIGFTMFAGGPIRDIVYEATQQAAEEAVTVL